jgi:hypothetical protein
MTGNEIGEGDIVRHRVSGKRGTVKTTDSGTYWQAPGDVTPLHWIVVWWDGEQRPVIEDPADLAGSGG